MTKDPFDLLGIEPRFDLDLAALARRVRELGRALHPDRHAMASAGERRRALSQSIDVNEAERELRDPLRRAQCLRRRLVLPGTEDTARPSPAFLMEILEQRESLAEARRARDLQRLQVLAEPMRQKEKSLHLALTHRFAAALGGAALDTQALDSELAELRYVRRYLDEVDETLDDA